MIYVSTEARKVVEAIAQFGVELSHLDHFEIEVVVSKFFPNHVLGVINKITGNMKPKSFLNMQEQGWEYFKKPIYNLLSARSSAQRKSKGEVPENAVQTYPPVASSLLLADMTRDEADFLIYDLPTWDVRMHEIQNAIKACRERDVRTVYYLKGVLSRERQRVEGKKREILAEREKIEPWIPPEDYSPLDTSKIDELASRWDRQASWIEIERTLREAQ